MRRLVLMRHAKSSWKTDAPSDHARPLNKRGRRDAPRVGARLRELGWVPDLVLASDSARTTETFERMRATLGYEGEAVFTRELYHAGTDELRAALATLSDEVETVLVLGHNPGWEEALGALTGRDEVMKTGCAALLSHDADDWPTASDAGPWNLHALIAPRELESNER